jgi:hypothetical protein
MLREMIDQQPERISGCDLLVVATSRDGPDEAKFEEASQLLRDGGAIDSRDSLELASRKLGLGLPGYRCVDAQRLISTEEDRRPVINGVSTTAGQHSNTLVHNSYFEISIDSSDPHEELCYRLLLLSVRMFDCTKRGDAMTMTTIAGPPRLHGPLGGADINDVGLLAARSAAAARRAQRGGQFDEIDRQALEALKELFVSSAETVTYFGSGGAHGAQPSSALAATVEATIDAVVPSVNTPEDSERLAAFLGEAAETIDQLLATQTSELAERVAALSSSLASAVNRENGHPGEQTNQL